MTRPARWNKHRPIALAIARDYRVPGMDADDVRQEALIALWDATGTYREERGTFPAWARIVVKARLADVLEAALRQKQRVLSDSVRDEQFLVGSGAGTEELVLFRERLREGLKARPELERAEAQRTRWREKKRRQAAAR